MTQSTNQWTIKTLGEVANLQKGMTITAKSARAGRVPVIAGGKKPAYFHAEANRPSKTITVSASGAYAGYVAFHGEPIWASDCITAVPTNLQICTPEFLYYFILSKQNEIYGLQRGSGMPHVYAKDLALLEIVIPPLDEQHRIVETLEDHMSRLDKALADLQQASIKSNHLFLAALDQAITECGQETYELLSNCLESLESGKYVQRGWSPQCLSHPQSDPSNWAVLKTTAVQNMRYEPQHNKELPKTLNPKYHLEVRPGDFLMTTTGPRNRCGVVCFVPDTPTKLIFSGKILRFRPDQTRVTPEWLELILASQKYQKQLDSLKVGSSDSSVSIGNAQVLELEIPIPPLEEQRRLVAKVQQMKELSTRFELEISLESKRFDTLRRSMLSAAFMGNLGIE